MLLAVTSELLVPAEHPLGRIAQDQAGRRTSITPLLAANRDAQASWRTQSLPQPTCFGILLDVMRFVGSIW